MIGVQVPGETTSSVTVRHLVEWLEQAGAPPSDWLATHGIARSALASPDLRVPINAFDALWASAIARDPAIGLRLIDRFPQGQMHLVTHLALRSATVGEALRVAERFMALTDPMDRLTCRIDGGIAVVSYGNAALIDGRRRNPGFVEHLFAMMQALLAQGAGRAVPLRAVSFRGPRLAHDADYRARFGVLPSFDAGEDALHVDATVLDWPLLTRDDYLRGLLERLADERLPARPTTLGERLAEHLRRGWLEGRALDLGTAAADLGLSPSRLRSQLAAEGCGFRQLQDATRREVARLHLAGTLSLGEIAWLLGFSEPAALQHAVRRWFGTSAGDMRAQLRAQAGSAANTG